MINNEDKKYYGTDYSTQAMLMEEEIYSYITNLNRKKLSQMKEMRNIAEQLKKDRNNADLKRELQLGQDYLDYCEKDDLEAHRVLDMVKQLKNGQIPNQVPPKVLYDKIMDIPLMQDLTASISFGERGPDMFNAGRDYGLVDEVLKKYIEENFVGSPEDEQELYDDYGIDFSRLGFNGSLDFHEFVFDELITTGKLNSQQKFAWIKEMRDDGLISNRDYLRMYIANEAHKRSQLAREMSKQQPVFDQTEENSFGGMKSSR